VAEELGQQLWGVRLDTSATLVDRSLAAEMENDGSFDPRGVNVRLVEIVRRALDEAGHAGVRIVASGGFDAAKIRAFEQAGAAVDAYGVGSALVRGENDFTADVVLVEGEPRGKRGRPFRPNPRLVRVP
jgi:nicotinate phosphoribosyltransferase